MTVQKEMAASHRATIEQMMTVRKEIVASQKAFLEHNKATSDRNKELMEMIKAQGEEIKALRALIQDSMSQRAYSEVTSRPPPSPPLPFALLLGRLCLGPPVPT